MHVIYLQELPPSTATQIYEGTNQIQRVVMARQLLK
jgi:alkylation response protein AidB-like acyl-CoA dehydrogenase